MNKRSIKWLKWKNPITKIEENGNESDSVVGIRQTPFGMEALKFNGDESNQLKIYVGNTNFDLGEYERDIIKDIDGVEALGIISPYRFHIAVGVNFNPKIVRQSVTDALCQDNQPNISPETSIEIYKQKLLLSQRSLYWFIYMFPNGKFKSFEFKNSNNMESKLSECYNIKNKIGGIIFLS